MADIFLSYARNDSETAKLAFEALKIQGWTVFRDTEHIGPGKNWRRVLEQELNQASIVLVIWSQSSIESDFVKDEADVGHERDVYLPISIDNARPPIGHRQIQTTDLTDWNGETDISAFSNYVELFADVFPILPIQNYCQTSTS